MNKLKENSIAITTGLFLAFGLMLTAVAYKSHPGDFINYYYSSWFLNHGQFDKFIYEPYLFNLEIRKHYSGFFFGNFTPVPPITAWVFSPFAVLPMQVAKVVFNVFSVILFSFSVFKLLKHLQLKSEWLLLLPLVFLLPLKSNIIQGQLYLILLALLVLGFLFTEQNRKTAAGFCFGAAIALKLFPAIVVLYLVRNKDFNVLIRTLFFVLVFVFVPYLVTRSDFTLDYYTQILPRLMAGEINDPWATAYQSVTVLLRQLFVYDPLLNTGTTLFNPALFKGLNTLFALLFSMAFVAVIYRTAERWQQFALTLFLGVLISGYGSVYGLLLLIPLLVAFSQHRYGYVVIALLAAVCFAPWQPASSYLLFKFARLWVMLILAVWLILQYGKKLLALPALFAVVTGLVYGYQKSLFSNQRLFDDVLAAQNNLLLFKYGHKADSLELSYITPAGITKDVLVFPDTLVTDNRIKMANNEIYFNQQQLTFNGGRKVKPLLNSAKGEVLYLGDAGRGVGFYTLKKVSLKE